MVSSDGDCELGDTTILQHNPRLSPLRIIDRGGGSTPAAVCHTHPVNGSRSVGVGNVDAIKSNKGGTNKSTKSSPKGINKCTKSSRSVSVTVGSSGINTQLSATSAAAVVAAATTTSFATTTNDVEL